MPLRTVNVPDLFLRIGSLEQNAKNADASRARLHEKLDKQGEQLDKLQDMLQQHLIECLAVQKTVAQHGIEIGKFVAYRNKLLGATATLSALAGIGAAKYEAVLRFLGLGGK